MRRVLVADPDRQNVQLVTQYLAEQGYSIQSVQDSDGVFHRIKAWKPHLLLLGTGISEPNGLEMIVKIRTLTSEDYTPIIIMVENMPPEEILRFLDAGADDCLEKPIQTLPFNCRVRSMLKLKEVQDSYKRAMHRIDELSTTDDLTGLMNMRAAFRRGEEEVMVAKKFRKPVSAILLNMDGFSQVNQNFGFGAGSRVLQEVAMRIKQCVRSVDHVARIGADEFFIFLKDTDLASAEFIAERIRDSIQSTSFKNEKQPIKLTATLGVAELGSEQVNQRMGDLLQITTEALRSAKANGVNRIEVYSFT